MKISQSEKEKVRRRIIESAVRLSSKKSFEDVTMRDIAKAASIADATIYKYFPAKEKILFSYFYLKLEDIIEHLKQIDGFNQYSFQEQLHTFLDVELDFLERDKEFFKNAYNASILTGPASVLGEIKASKELFFSIIKDLVASAVEVGEFPQPAFESFLYELLYDFNVAVIYYWLNDTSKNRVSTTQMIDKSLNLITELLHGSIFAKIADLAQFLFREHIINRMTHKPEKRNFDLQKLKRQFMKTATNL